MKLSAAALLLAIGTANAAFVPQTNKFAASRRVVLKGYLDDITKDLYGPDANPDLEGDSKDKTDLKKDDVDRYGPGEWDSYRDFGDEFDGGDGQMGVAGDGNKGLEKFGDDVSPMLAKSKTMSAKNAWGKSTGYAEKLMDEGMEVVRAQQMENWKNQQELRAKKNEHMKMTEEFDKVNYEEDWRTLAKFGVERNQDFDFDEEFGAVTAGDELEDTIEMHSRIGVTSIHEFKLRNDFMGFSDFRAAFTPETPKVFSVTPPEGSISGKEDTEFVIKFRPENPGTAEGHLVIQTEDFKKTWKFIGSTS